MLSTEDSDLYEVTCLDCNTTKSYFTAQGVSYFKLNHEGHKVKARAPGSSGEASSSEATAAVVTPVQMPEGVSEAFEESTVEEASEYREEGPVRLEDLVVDIVDEGTGRMIKVYGISGGTEKFTKGFTMNQLSELNGFLESGLSVDDSSRMSYKWSPDKIDISNDVVRMIDESSATVAQEKVESTDSAGMVPVEAQAPISEVVESEPTHAEETRGPVEPVQAPQPPSEEVLFGKLSYIQPGENNRLESIRVSRVLRRFRWNVQPPYVVGAIMDDLISIQSQTGNIEAAVIDAVAKLGYTFVAIEAPAGCVTAWFRNTESA